MRLSTRMTVTVGMCAAVLFGVLGVFQLRREETDLRAVARNETLLLAKALQTAFENALRDRQVEDVAETLNALQRVDPTVAIVVFDETGRVVGVSEGAAATSETHRLGVMARSSREPIIEFEPDTGPEVLRVGLRLREETPTDASAIVLEKPLTELRRDLAVTKRDIAWVVLFFVAGVATLAWVITRRYVGVPLARLVADMRRVREGHLEVRPNAPNTDEVGETQREFEELVRALDATRQRADQELEARQRMEQGLRDADKLITLGQLSAVLAHEIGSPLQVLEGRVRSLLKKSDPETIERIVPLVVGQTERITRIVTQLLEITRKRPPARTTTDFARAAQSVVDLLELEARRRRILLKTSYHGHTTLDADADQLQQVALNLIRNAIQASPVDSTIEISLRGESDHVTLEVSDAGPGVPSNVLEKLFEPFFTTRSAHGGTGLGLSVVKSIVQEHQGTVCFVPQNEGALVRVVLPRKMEL